MMDRMIEEAAKAVRDADALLITAGAGMGVDSGLPDFRGPEGFWAAYPPYRELGLCFEQLANPAHFWIDPHLVWGFCGHRLHLYRQTQPHDGFRILHDWAMSKNAGFFVFTSNVDGHFAAAGIPEERIVECHGSIHHLQCSQSCEGAIWSAASTEIQVDPETMRANDPLPRCPYCGSVARPNILMFADGGWISRRTDESDAAYDRWRAGLSSKRVCVIECGAGTAIPTVRLESERIAKRTGGRLLRVNVREPEVPAGHLGIPLPAREALQRIAAVV
jgi:NAD-dependent SIR2 family protein deacetylase